MKKWLKTGISFLVILGLLSGCGANTKESGDSAENGTDHLNIATQPAPAYLPLQIMQDKGWLEEALAENGYDNVKVTLTEFESGPPENESFATGGQDVGVMGNVPSIGGIASGQKRTFIGISSNGEKTQAVLVASDSAITSIEELQGKKIGLVVGSISQNLLDTLLNEKGLSISDVELVNLGVAELQEALSCGQVDAIVTWEPTLTKLQSNGTAKVLADGSGVFLGENTIFARDEYLEENPEIVKIFLQQYARATKELVDNKEAYAEEYAEKYGLDVETFKVVLENAQYPFVITEEDVADLQETADFLYREKLITTEVNVKEHVDDSFSKEESILSYLGK